MLQDESLLQKFTKKGFWLYLFAFLIAPAGYLIRMVISWSLDTDEVGLFYSVISFVLLVSIYNDLWLTEALVYFLPRYWIKKKYNFFVTALFSTLVMQITSWFLLAWLLYYLSDWLAFVHFRDVRAGEMLRYLLFYFIGINIFQVLSAFFNSFQDIFTYKFVELCRIWSVAAFSFYYFWSWSHEVLDFVFAWIFGVFIGVIVALFLFLKNYLRVWKKWTLVYDSHETKKYLKFAFWTFLAMNSWTLLGQVDQQMITNMLTLVDAWFYTNYFSLFGTYAVVFAPIMGFMYPVISEMMAKWHAKSIISLQNTIYTYLVILWCSFSFFLIVLGPEIATVLFTEKFRYSWELVQYGAWFIVLNIITSISFFILSWMGFVKEKVFILIGATLVNIVLNYLFIPLWGLEGVIASTAFWQLLLAWSSFYYVHKQNAITIDGYIVLSDVLLFALLGLSIRLGKWSLDLFEQSRLTLFVIIFCFGIAYYSIFALLNWKRLQKIFYLIRNQKTALS